METSTLGLIILSLFCAGGIFAYVREARRLSGLMAAGTLTEARIINKKKIDTGSESVVHYLVSYEFSDKTGNNVVHEEDLNSPIFFNTLTEGDVIPILYIDAPRPASYPLSQVRRDRAIALGITLALVFFWIAMSAVLLAN
jgi:hypothetical protein